MIKIKIKDTDIGLEAAIEIDGTSTYELAVLNNLLDELMEKTGEKRKTLRRAYKEIEEMRANECC